MGKGLFEQESGVVGIQLQAQVINSYHGKSPNNMVTAPVTSMSSYAVVLPGGKFNKFPKFPMSSSSSLSPHSLSTGSFPDTQPPISLSFEMSAFPENDNSFFRSLEQSVDSSVVNQYFLNLSKSKGYFKQCPTGKQGGGASGTRNNSSSSSTNGSSTSYSMWSGASQTGFSGGIGGAGGGDDDPHDNDPYGINSIPDDLLFEVEENSTFNPFNYLDTPIEDLDTQIEDLIRDMPQFGDFVLPANPSAAGGFNLIRDQTQSYPTDPSSTTDPPSTPAPLTPGPSHPVTPMTPMTTQMLPNTSTLVGSPNCTSVEQSDHSDNTQDLLEIQKLMINSGSRSNHHINDTSLIPTMGHTSATLVPQQPSYHTQETQRQHVPTVRPTRSIIAPQQPTKQNDTIDFLTTNLSSNDLYHCIELFVPFNLTPDKIEIGHKALQHNYTVYLQFQDALKDSSLSELQVATHEVAKLCTMELSHAQSPKVCFKMPITCVPLSRWVQENHSVLKRQLVIQQMVNTLTILFKAQNNLCFWGSSQLWIDTNYRVYLYIDFIKALATQKEYVERGMVRVNPRVEDCKVLIDVYDAVLKPYLQRDTTWVSPELRVIFKTFEDILQYPENCVSNMAYVARVLGNRRICQLRVSLMIGASIEYDIFCAEHEKLSAALEAVTPMLPTAIARQWAVVRSHDNSPVGMVEIAVKETEGSYILIPLPDNFQKFPGALYIESKQTLSW